MSKNVLIFNICLFNEDISPHLKIESYFLKTLTNSDATDVTIPIKENQMVVELPTPEVFAFTEFG